VFNVFRGEFRASSKSSSQFSGSACWYRSEVEDGGRGRLVFKPFSSQSSRVLVTDILRLSFVEELPSSCPLHNLGPSELPC
jgi:hypothetical protein